MHTFHRQREREIYRPSNSSCLLCWPSMAWTKLQAATSAASAVTLAGKVLTLLRHSSSSSSIIDWVKKRILTLLECGCGSTDASPPIACLPVLPHSSCCLVNNELASIWVELVAASLLLLLRSCLSCPSVWLSVCLSPHVRGFNNQLT